MNSMDTRRDGIATTNFSTAGFAHKLYVYDTNSSWKYMGYSLSEYYYKHLYMLYYDSNLNMYTSEDYNFTSSPEEVAEADHYMNYNWLSNKAIEYWTNNSGTYVETY